MAKSTTLDRDGKAVDYSHEDLGEKLAELAGARKLCDADDAKRRKSVARRDHAEHRLRHEAVSQGLEFDPAELPELHPLDADLHRRHHRLHYEVAEIEKALGIRQPEARPK